MVVVCWMFWILIAKKTLLGFVHPGFEPGFAVWFQQRHLVVYRCFLKDVLGRVVALQAFWGVSGWIFASLR